MGLGAWTGPPILGFPPDWPKRSHFVLIGISGTFRSHAWPSAINVLAKEDGDLSPQSLNFPSSGHPWFWRNNVFLWFWGETLSGCSGHCRKGVVPRLRQRERLPGAWRPGGSGRLSLPLPASWICGHGPLPMSVLNSSLL